MGNTEIGLRKIKCFVVIVEMIKNMTDYYEDLRGKIFFLVSNGKNDGLVADGKSGLGDHWKTG